MISGDVRGRFLEESLKRKSQVLEEACAACVRFTSPPPKVFLHEKRN